MHTETLQTIDAGLSAAAKRRLLCIRGEPLFVAGWHRALMIHFEVNAEDLRRDVPFELDLFEGRGFVSTVAFTMRGMRPYHGGKWLAWLFRPIATHDFLNVRTYVRHCGEPGIHFLAEWLSSSLAVKFGPRTFGLPYRHGRISYQHDWRNGKLLGRVADVSNRLAFAYRADLEISAPLVPCVRGSLDEWLMERYTAFNAVRDRRNFFRVWHPPWPQCPAHAVVTEKSLLMEHWHWFDSASLIGANFSTGFDEVWMGRPHRAA